MKLKLKILKENRSLLQEGYEGLYQTVGVMPGSLDLFIKHFVDVPTSVSRKTYEFIKNNFTTDIESLTESDIPSTSSRGRATPLDKVKVGLYWGQTYWWHTIFGASAAQEIIEFKVLSYLNELADGLRRIGYSTITAEEFDALPQEDKNLVFEKHFIEDHVDSFFTQHVQMNSMNTTGFVGNLGTGAGLYGQMKDWWMSTEGADIMKGLIKSNLSLMPTR